MNQPPYTDQPQSYSPPSNPGYPPQPPYSQALPPQQLPYPPQMPPQQSPYPPQMPPQQSPYPPQMSPQVPPLAPKKSGGKNILWIAAIIVTFILGIIVGHASAGSTSTTPNTGTINQSTPGSTPGSTPTQVPTTSKHFKVGDTVTIGNTWKVVVNSVKTDNGGQYSSLKTGDTYVVVDISLTNISKQEQPISSLLSFTLQDSTGQKYDESIDTNAGATPDGKVAAGSPLRGSIAYEVPSSVKQFTFSFAPDITSSGQTIWDLSV